MDVEKKHSIGFLLSANQNQLHHPSSETRAVTVGCAGDEKLLLPSLSSFGVFGCSSPLSLINNTNNNNNTANTATTGVPFLSLPPLSPSSTSGPSSLSSPPPFTLHSSSVSFLLSSSSHSLEDVVNQPTAIQPTAATTTSPCSPPPSPISPLPKKSVTVVLSSPPAHQNNIKAHFSVETILHDKQQQPYQQTLPPVYQEHQYMKGSASYGPMDDGKKQQRRAQQLPYIPKSLTNLVEQTMRLSSPCNVTPTIAASTPEEFVSRCLASLREQTYCCILSQGNDAKGNDKKIKCTFSSNCTKKTKGIGNLRRHIEWHLRTVEEEMRNHQAKFSALTQHIKNNNSSNIIINTGSSICIGNHVTDMAGLLQLFQQEMIAVMKKACGDTLVQIPTKLV